MNRILITGASGFIGKRVLQELKKVQVSLEIHGVYYQYKPVDEKITWHRCNLLDSGEATRLFDEVKPSHLIHLAWCSEHGKYWKDVQNLEWVKAGINIARRFAENKGRRCVFIGSSAEYDWGINDFLKEDSPIKPESLYGASKYALYLILSEYFKQENVSWAWGRLFNVFGEEEDERRLIPRTCLSLLNDDPIDMDSAISKRDFLHVQDASEAIIDILFNSINGPVNIASGLPISVKEIVSQIGRQLNKNHLITFNKSGASEMNKDFVVANVEKLNNYFHWKPSVALSQRITSVCEWWKIQNNK